MLLRAMSSCSATTSRFSESPASRGAASCAATTPAARNTGVSRGKARTPPARAQSSVDHRISLSDLKARPRNRGATAGQSGRIEVRPEAVRGSGRGDRGCGGRRALAAESAAAPSLPTAASRIVDWDGAVVSNGRADRAVVVGQGRCCPAGRRGHYDGRASRSKGQLMVVPGKQKRLENDRKDGNERREPARSMPAPRKKLKSASTFTPPASLCPIWAGHALL